MKIKQIESDTVEAVRCDRCGWFSYKYVIYPFVDVYISVRLCKKCGNPNLRTTTGTVVKEYSYKDVTKKKFIFFKKVVKEWVLVNKFLKPTEFENCMSRKIKIDKLYDEFPS